MSEVSGCHSPLFVRGKNAALCRTTAWNAVRQCALWLDEPGPPPSLELKIAGIELKLADKQRGHELKQAAQSSSSNSLLQAVDLKQNKHDCQQQYLRQYNICRLRRMFFFVLFWGWGVLFQKQLLSLIKCIEIVRFLQSVSFDKTTSRSYSCLKLPLCLCLCLERCKKCDNNFEV